MSDLVLSRHLDWCAARNLRAATIFQRRCCISRLRRFLGERDLLDATATDIVDHVNRPLSPEGRATEISHIRQFYAWAVDEGLLDTSPAARLRRPRLPRRLPRPMDQAGLLKAIHLADDRVGPWLWLAAYAGLRCREIAYLRREDVLDHNDPPMILVVDGKGGGQRLIPMADELLAEYQTWPKPTSGWLFPRLDGRPGPTPPHRISQLGNEHLRACGVDATMHQARHLFGTTVYRETKDLRLVQELLGHASPNTTAGYAAWSPADAAAAVAGLRYADDSAKKVRRRSA